MRILLDENIDRLLKPLFDSSHDVLTVHERGWAGLKNGMLLRAAELEFDIFVTMDGNLEYQQNLKKIDMAILVLKARSNVFSVIAPLMPDVNEALRSVESGAVVHISGF